MDYVYKFRTVLPAVQTPPAPLNYISLFAPALTCRTLPAQDQKLLRVDVDLSLIRISLPSQHRV